MIETRYLNFQEDLRNGLSLDDALIKHNLILVDAFNTLHSLPMPIKKKENIPDNKYLLIRKTSVQLRKSFNGKWKTYGSYRTIEDARRIRDYLISQNWKCDDLDAACQEIGVTRIKSKRGRY